jgi:diacylglycerol kinase (ATP)
VSRAAVVVNPAARGGAAVIAVQVAASLREWFDVVNMLPTTGSGVLLPDDATLVVAVGGDGTAREVAQSVAESPGAAQMLIVPAGTGNSLHHALWADMPWRETLALLRGGEVVCRRLDLARIEGHGRLVLLGASAGFLRWAVEATSRFPALSGRELYEQAAFAAAAELRPYAGRVIVDGDVLCEGPIALAAVGGAQRRGGSLAILPHSSLDDGLLDVCALVAADSATAVAQLMAALQGAHLDMPGVHYAHGRTVTLESLDGPLPFEHDGDIWEGDEMSLTLTVIPAAVPMIIPSR